ncbi:MAG: NUDIX hydrolase [Isosphaeraceae bacterium]
MAPPYCYPYPRPAVTVDLVVFAPDGPSRRVLLIRRKHDPFAGKLALPGGFLDMDERAMDGARRELREETGLDHPGPIAFVGYYDDPGRDPRGRTIGLAFAAVLDGPPPAVAGADDAAEALWLTLEAAVAADFAFDHAKILADALAWLDRRSAGG